MYRIVIGVLVTIAILLYWVTQPQEQEPSTNLPAQGPNCHYWASPSGDNNNPGTKAKPFLTAGKLVNSLSPGQVGCFELGVYRFEELSISGRPRITLTSAGKQKATLQGRIRIERSSPAVVIERLVLNGRNPDNLAGPLIYASEVVLRDNIITNENTTICVHLDSYYDAPRPKGVKIVNNRIHHCGRLPATNYDHGIYLAEAHETIIRGNKIFNNADRGIQLYPNADKTIIRDNVISGNGQGVIVGGDEHETSSDNRILRNLITDSRLRFNIESSWGGPVGAGNVFKRNCLWTASKDYYGGTPNHSGIMTPTQGFSVSRSRIAAPSYSKGKRSSFKLRRGSPCHRWLGWR